MVCMLQPQKAFLKHGLQILPMLKIPQLLSAIFTGLQSICTMLASTITGFIWFQFGAFAAFVTTAIVTVLVAIYFFAAIPRPK